MRFLKSVLILGFCLVLITFAGCSPTVADSDDLSEEDSTTPSTPSIDTGTCLGECLDFCKQWCPECTVCNCEEGPVTSSSGETCLGQCFDFCEQWYDACQECVEEETCDPCQQEEEESEEGCAGGNCPLG
ncbi:MAG: hypothetical protein PWP04_947 [Candidatus Atribacteria bacterium]|nr:hypothetical protein [Candidatus Atribacteria bacterium]